MISVSFTFDGREMYLKNVNLQVDKSRRLGAKLLEGRWGRQMNEQSVKVRKTWAKGKKDVSTLQFEIRV